MSARNYLSGREKQFKLINCLPSINQQKFFYSSGQPLPTLSANTSSFINRNVNYSFQVEPSFSFDNGDRSGTPFSDFFSESETGTPDFRSEESDSSTGSVLRRNTAEATKLLADEWERIERTIYDEEGEKITRPQMREECQQWRQIHPHLRVVGKAIKLPEKRLNYRNIELDETIAVHYSDHEPFSEGSERLSQSSTDVTPQNSPRVSVAEDLGDNETRLTREKITSYSTYEDEEELPDTFRSILQITPIQIHSPLQRKRLNSSILKSDVASSRWMRNNRPDSSVNCDRNSAKSFISLDTRNYSTIALSASDRDKVMNRVVTARQRDKLGPLYTPDIPQSDIGRLSLHQLSVRKVSLPPLLLEEEKRKIGTFGSATKTNINSVRPRKGAQKSLFQIDRVKHI